MENNNRVRIWNHNQYPVGIVTVSGISRNIAPKTSMLLTEDDVLLIKSSTTLFEDKALTLDSRVADAEYLGLNEEDKVYDSDEEIKQKLNKLTTPKLRTYLETVVQIPLRHKIISLAKECDLNASKIKLIEQVFEMPVFND